MRGDNNGLPWYHETPEAHFFNEWTVTHLAWGALSNHFIDSDVLAIALHTTYEYIEADLFPREHRDVSLENHIGDSLAFILGRWARR